MGALENKNKKGISSAFLGQNQKLFLDLAEFTKYLLNFQNCEKFQEPTHHIVYYEGLFKLFKVNFIPGIRITEKFLFPKER